MNTEQAITICKPTEPVWLLLVNHFKYFVYTDSGNSPKTDSRSELRMGHECLSAFFSFCRPSDGHSPPPEQSHCVLNILHGSLIRTSTISKSQRAMAQAVSRRPLIAEARVRFWVSPSGICGVQSGTETGVSPSTSVFTCQFHYTGAPLLEKTKKLITFITGLHNKPQGCRASVASAAGPFTKRKSHNTSIFISQYSMYI